MSNSKFYNALNQIPQVTPPIWFMRQAGRYHSHYQQLKLKYTFEELCKNAELAAEVACGPVEEFDFDVAILFSDILFVLEGLGLKLEFNPGPIFKEELNLKNYKKFTDIDKKERPLTIEDFLIVSPYNAQVNFLLARLPDCLLYTSPSPRDRQKSRMPSSA